MSSYINWGNETPDQLADRRRREQEEIALWEQAVNARAGQTPIAAPGAAAGGSGGGFSQIADTAIFISSDPDKPNYQINSLNFNSSFGTTVDSGIDSGDYYLSETYVTQSKGYLFVFRGNQDYNDYALLFTGAEGNVLLLNFGTTSDLTASYSRGAWVYAYDYDARILWYSDGINAFRNETILADTYYFEIGANQVDSNSFGLGVSTAKEVGSPTEYQWDYFLIPSPTKDPVLVKSDTSSSSATAFIHTMRAKTDIVIREEYVNYIGEYLSFTVLDSKGTVKQSVNLASLSPGMYQAREIYYYGQEKYLFIYYNEGDDSVDYLMLSYDALTDTLQTQTHERGGDYTNFFVFNESNYYPGNFTSNAYSENIAVAVYNSVNEDYGMFEVDGCDFILFMHGQNPLVTTFDVVSSAAERHINFYGVVATPTSFFIPCDNGDGMISVLALGGPHDQEFNNLGSPGYSRADYAIETNYCGTRVLFRLYTKNSPYSTDLILFDADSFTQLGNTLLISGNNYNVYYAYDSIYIRLGNPQGTITGYSFRRNSTSWEEIGFYVNRRYQTPYYQGGSTYDPGNLLVYNDTERIFWFTDYPDSGNDISDGGNDMYDQGNILNTDLGNNIPYTHTQSNINRELALPEFAMDGEIVAGTNSDFGNGSNYFTNLYPGLFVLSVDSPSINSFSITGGLGSDGDNTGGDYNQATITHNSQSYTYFWKREWQEGSDIDTEPSVNHLIIIDSDGTDVTHSASGFNDDSDDDSISYNNPSNLPITKLHYLVFSKWNRVKVENSELGAIVNSYLNLVDPVGQTVTFADTLTNLNANYSNVTASLPPHILGKTCKMLSPTGVSTFSIIGIDNLLVGKNRILSVYADPQKDGKIVAKLYNFSGTLIRNLTTNEYEWDNAYAIGTHIFFITRQKAYDGMNWWYNYTVYRITDLGVTAKTIKVSQNDNFYKRNNDFTYWYAD